MAETQTRAEQLIYITALCGLLLEALERLDDEDIASEELLAALRDTCERARDELANARAADD